MKLPFLVLLFIAFSSYAHAVPAGEKNSPKQLQMTAKKTVPNATTPFDLTAERLPENYAGHSVLGIYQKLIVPRPKGEFEKSEEYEARITRWKESAILGKVTPTSTLAFEISEFMAPGALSVKYDADKEELTANISFESHHFDFDRVQWLETFYQSKNLGSHIGITRMGVKFRVTSHIGTSIGIGTKDEIEPISITKAYSRDEALRVKSSIRAYAIATLHEPYKIDNSTSSTASLDSPDEWLTRYLGLYVRLYAIWIVNAKTGEVIAKSETHFAQ